MRTLTGFISAVAISASVIGTPAFAAVTALDSVTPDAADSTTEAEQQSRCDALLATYDTGDGSRWAADVVLGDVTYVTGPNYVGTHSIGDAVGEVVGAGTYTPAHRQIVGDPFRNGGSPNMFGLQQAVGGHYSASSYDFEGLFASTYSHGFSCDISVERYHAAWTEHVPADPNGYYVNFDNGKGNGNDNDGTDGNIQGSCVAHNNTGPSWDRWGEDTNQCQFVGERAHDVDHPEYWDDAEFVINLTATAVNQDQEDTLLSHEDAGEGFYDAATVNIGTPVVCISPGKKGGTWTQQNGYTGAKCTTTWYNSGATVGVSNLNTGSHNWVTIPVL